MKFTSLYADVFSGRLQIVQVFFMNLVPQRHQVLVFVMQRPKMSFLTLCEKERER